MNVVSRRDKKNLTDAGEGIGSCISSSHRFTMLIPRRSSEGAGEEGFLAHGSISGRAFPRRLPVTESHSAVAFMRPSSPITAAGPRWILTIFPTLAGGLPGKAPETWPETFGHSKALASEPAVQTMKERANRQSLTP